MLWASDWVIVLVVVLGALLLLVAIMRYAKLHARGKFPFVEVEIRGHRRALGTEPNQQRRGSIRRWVRTRLGGSVRASTVRSVGGDYLRSDTLKTQAHRGPTRTSVETEIHGDTTDSEVTSIGGDYIEQPDP